MDSLIFLYAEISNFLISKHLLKSYLFFLILMFITIVLDWTRFKNRIVVKGFFYQFLSFLMLFFFVFLYIDSFQTLNNEIMKFRSGSFAMDINITESTSNYFKNKIGNSYSAGVIALLSGIFASFLKLQFVFIEKGYFCKNKNNGSLFLNFIMILNIFSILTFIDHLKYSEFKISEGVAMSVNSPSYFFSILLITSLIMFFVTLFWHKESLLSELIKEKEKK